MTNEKIARINELYKKSKAEGLSEEEKKERHCCVMNMSLR